MYQIAKKDIYKHEMYRVAVSKALGTFSASAKYIELTNGLIMTTEDYTEARLHMFIDDYFRLECYFLSDLDDSLRIQWNLGEHEKYIRSYLDKEQAILENGRIMKW